MIYKKLLSIQTQLKAPKGQTNNFGHYKYRNCEDILEAVKPLCKANDTVLWLSDELVMIGERYYIKATATLREVTGDGEVRATAYAREEQEKKGMDGSQVTGASSSYARKYALNGLFDIDDTKDSDTTNEGEEKPLPPVKDKVDLTKDPIPEMIKCETCNAVILPAKDKSGNKISAKERAEMSKAACGKVLCGTCSKEQAGHPTGTEGSYAND